MRKDQTQFPMDFCGSGGTILFLRLTATRKGVLLLNFNDESACL
ncbi:hypothetical protein Lalb_Chr07g0187221 [Lupinus albus]|uniref:Uncharacterized protein n=1 Tax=Lupinus albus TaxID=3870 RepID=A0A6A4Q994_LUPAL|nr:hypothetical protein Lalb_Chr07g0187221 [Lupinus albus]